MTQRFDLHTSTAVGVQLRPRWWPAWAGLALATALIALYTPRVTAAPGDAYVYRVINAYNKETVGHVRQELTSATTAQGQVLSVSVDNAALGVARTEMYTPDGRWLRRPLDNHGMPVEYDFSAALPAVQPSLAPGQSWSLRVPARVAGEARNRSVRIDGKVLGNERIRVPAGEFDTVKTRRAIYAGDVDYFISETLIYETDWYAPALGRPVKSESKSSWLDTSRCTRGGCPTFRGDWNIFELAEISAAKP